MSESSPFNNSNNLVELIDKEINQFITEDEEVLNFPSFDTPKDKLKRLIIKAFNRGEKYGRFYALMEMKDALKERGESSEISECK